MSNKPVSKVRRSIYVLLVALLAFSWGDFALTFSRDHRLVEQDCHRLLTSHAIALDRHIRQKVQLIQVFLSEISQHFLFYSDAQLQSTLDEWFKDCLGHVSFNIIDIQGQSVLFSSSRSESVTTVEIDRLLDQLAPEQQFQVGNVVFKGRDGRDKLAFSKQFTADGDRFLAVFFASAERFVDFFPQEDLDVNGSVALYHRQGGLLVQGTAGGSPAHSVAEHQQLARLLANSPTGIFESEGKDGQRWITAYRELQGLPLVITADVSTDQVFAEWRNRLNNVLLIQVAVSLVVFISLLVLSRSLARVESVERDLATREEHFRETANSSVDAVISIGEDDRIQFWSTGAEKMFDCLAADALQMPIACFLQFVTADKPVTLKQLAEQQAALPVGRTLDVLGQRKDGGLFPTELSVSCGTVAGRPLYTLIVRNVTERKLAEDRIKRLASHDNLTGLPNRTLFMDRLQVAMAQVRRQGGRFALLFVDLDHFKPVNDNYGHDVGDHLLQQVAARMLNTVRASDTVARIGGDEFALVLNNVGEEKAVVHTCEALLRTLSKEYQVSGIQAEISASIGVVLFDGQELSPTDLIRRADNAMYAAKRAGKNCCRFFGGKDDHAV